MSLIDRARSYTGEVIPAGVEPVPVPVRKERSVFDPPPRAGVDPIEERRLADTVTNVLALSEPEYQQWVQEIERAAPHDPNLHHDREAWRRVRAARALFKL